MVAVQHSGPITGIDSLQQLASMGVVLQVGSGGAGWCVSVANEANGWLGREGVPSA